MIKPDLVCGSAKEELSGSGSRSWRCRSPTSEQPAALNPNIHTLNRTTFNVRASSTQARG